MIDYMSADTVIRSLRLDRGFNERLEALAAERGVSVSAYIRNTLTGAIERDARRRRLERALRVAADLPEPDAERDVIWGVGERVPR
jgi:predicted DNA-binding ribbon-helix-helix protein